MGSKILFGVVIDTETGVEISGESGNSSYSRTYYKIIGLKAYDIYRRALVDVKLTGIDKSVDEYTCSKTFSNKKFIVEAITNRDTGVVCYHYGVNEYDKSKKKVCDRFLENTIAFPVYTETGNLFTDCGKRFISSRFTDFMAVVIDTHTLKLDTVLNKYISKLKLTSSYLCKRIKNFSSVSCLFKNISENMYKHKEFIYIRHLHDLRYGFDIPLSVKYLFIEALVPIEGLKIHNNIERIGLSSGSTLYIHAMKGKNDRVSFVGSLLLAYMRDDYGFYHYNKMDTIENRDLQVYNKLSALLYEEKYSEFKDLFNSSLKITEYAYLLLKRDWREYPRGETV